MILFLANEYLICLDVHIGYLHRGTEKVLELRTLEQCLPFFDRLDYCSVLCNEHVFCFALESLLRVLLTIRVSCVRVCVLELTRIFNGLLCLACMMFDMGCLTPLL